MTSLALEIQDRVDHVLQHPGAGDGAFLGDMADQDHRLAPTFCDPDQLLSTGADLGHGSRRGIQRVHIHRLNGIDDGHIGGVGCVEGGKDVANIGCGREENRRVGQT